MCCERLGGELVSPPTLPQHMSSPPSLPQQMSSPPNLPQHMNLPPNLPQHMSSPPIFSEVRSAQSLVFCDDINLTTRNPSFNNVLVSSSYCNHIYYGDSYGKILDVLLLIDILYTLRNKNEQ
jgi:hypothetical protein